MRPILAFLFSLISFFCQAQWQKMNGPEAGAASQIVSNDQFLFATTPTGVFRSADGGENWQEITGQHFKPDFLPASVFVSGQNVAVLCHRNWTNDTEKTTLFLSQNQGIDWQEVALPAPRTSGGFAVLPEKLLFLESGKIWELPFGEKIWRPNSLNADPNFGYSVRVMNGKVYIGGFKFIAESDLQAENWTKIPIPVLETVPQNFWADGDTIFVDEYRSAPNKDFSFRSVDHGQTWEPMKYTSWTDFAITNIARSGGIFLGTINSDIVRSFDGGKTWEWKSQDLPDIYFYELFETKDGLFASDHRTTYRVLDQGKQVQRVQNGLHGGHCESLFANDSVLLVAAGKAGLHRFQKASKTWSDGSVFPFLGKEVISAHQKNGRIFAGINSEKADSCLFMAESSSLDWKKAKIVGNGFDYYSLDQIESIGQHVFALDKYDGYAFASSDFGQNWADVSPAPKKVVPHNNLFFASGLDEWRLKTSPTGTNWQFRDSVGFSQFGKLLDFYIAGSSVYAWASGTLANLYKKSLLRSDDFGLTWHKIGTDLPIKNLLEREVLGNDSFILLNQYFYGIYFSKDKGETFHRLRNNLEGAYTYPFFADSDHFYAPIYGTGLWQLPQKDLPIAHLHGMVYHDQNANSQRDPGEPPLRNIAVGAKNSRFFTSTDSAGAFSMFEILPSGVPDTLFFSVPGSTSFQPNAPISMGIGQLPLEIGLKTLTTGTDLAVFVSPIQPLFFGNPFEMALICKNIAGKLATAGQLFLVNDQKLATGFFQPQPDLIFGDTLMWNLPVGLQPDQYFLIKMGGTTPANLAWNDPFRLKFWVKTPTPDDNLANNLALFEGFAAEAPIQNLNWTSVNRVWMTPAEAASGTSLVYSFGFRTSFFSAKDPYFLTVFEQETAPSTLRILASSHPVEVFFVPEGYCHFQFRGVLPDSSAGDSSRLWVVFSVEPDRGLQDGQFVQNFAGFKYNVGNGISGTPNISTTFITDFSPVSAKEPPWRVKNQGLAIFPNPTTGFFEISSTADFPLENVGFQIFDAAGRVLKNGKISGKTIQVDLPTGIYFLKILGKSETRTCRFVAVRR